LTRILYVLGTRPEVIRSARILQLLANSEDVELLILSTGQHYDERMLSGFLRELDVPPVTYDLGVGSLDPVEQTARIIAGTGGVIREANPDSVCVFGDTNSTLGGALAAAKAEVPLVHIEAGCRSFDQGMPEELNRRAVDHMSTLLLAVSELAAHNLERERVMGEVHIVGDPQFDMFLEQTRGLTPAGESNYGLITLHRQENADDPVRLAAILSGISKGGGDLEWIFPVHPRTAKRLPAVPAGVRTVAPVLYRELLQLLLSARVCVTDSGGLQKEAFWARVPCVTVRATTEWMETVAQGANELATPVTVATAVAHALTKRLPVEHDNPYGDGRASEEIASILRVTQQVGR
jgi:UDP-N-acetylglucosamine 2-epimerase